ncbi:PorT family protein [Bacteroides sp. 214]|uniref:porin family protein n=1 Tax=Bacteroides sp. 214 TaxID=2302935 RepID=UPI0013D65EFF|nr:porin family protein [Bacteroides sp. 214]NDW11499.1 PorT family protein [Bacteroides sp. 214]
MNLKYTLLFIAGLFIFLPLQAQKETTKGLEWAAAHGLEYSVRAGFNIGGTAPIPLPEEIRAIKRYSPQLSLSIEGTVTKWLDSNWGIQTGIRLESKAMSTKARVKNYSIELSVAGEAPLLGRWTGDVKTDVNNTYLTIPLLAKYKLNSCWDLHGGVFFSYLLDGDFSGNVYDGYLRDGDPTGTKVEFTGNDTATYEFSDDLRKIQWGAQIGADWKAFKHLTVNANLTWGFMDIFKSNFKTITFSMYPIYLNVGFGYVF